MIILILFFIFWMKMTDDKQKIKISNTTKDRVAACKAYIESKIIWLSWYLKKNIRSKSRRRGKRRKPGNSYSSICRNWISQLKRRRSSKRKFSRRRQNTWERSISLYILTDQTIEDECSWIWTNSNYWKRCIRRGESMSGERRRRDCGCKENEKSRNDQQKLTC